MIPEPIEGSSGPIPELKLGEPMRLNKPIAHLVRPSVPGKPVPPGIRPSHNDKPIPPEKPVCTLRKSCTYKNAPTSCISKPSVDDKASPAPKLPKVVNKQRQD